MSVWLHCGTYINLRHALQSTSAESVALRDTYKVFVVEFARSHEAESSLLMRPTVGVVVGHAHGHTHATADGAGTP